MAVEPTKGTFVVLIVALFIGFMPSAGLAFSPNDDLFQTTCQTEGGKVLANIRQDQAAGMKEFQDLLKQQGKPAAYRYANMVFRGFFESIRVIKFQNTPSQGCRWFYDGVLGILEELRLGWGNISNAEWSEPHFQEVEHRLKRLEDRFKPPM